MRPSRGSSKTRGHRPGASHVNNGVNRKQGRHSPPRFPNGHRVQDRNDRGARFHNDDHNSRRDDGYDSRGYGYSFRGAADHYSRSSRDDFTFRSNGPRAPSFPQVNHDFDHRNHRNDRRPYNQGQRNARDRPPQGRRPHNNRSFVPAHDRSIFRNTRRSPTPEQLQGMDTSGAAKFKDIQELSDGRDAEDSSNPNKRMKLNEGQAAIPAVTSKWSNPDPYDALPPTATTNKMNLVQAIRQAKEENNPAVDSAAMQKNDDFISFDDTVLEEDDAPRLSSNAPKKAKSHTKPQPARDIPRASQPPHTQHEANLPPRPQHAPSASVMQSITNLPKKTAAREQRYGGQPDISCQQNEDKKRKRQGETRDSGQASSRTPWFRSHVDTNDSLRLHTEICDFYEYVRPTQQDDLGRRALLERVQRTLQGCDTYSYWRPELHAFGSFASSLYLPTADMDLVALSSKFVETGTPCLCVENRTINALAKYLRKTNIAKVGSVVAIAHSRVPLIKWIDRLTGIRVDLSFENVSGLRAITTTRDWIQQFPEMPAIVAIIKRLLDVSGMNDVHTGGLGGFAIICLVVSMMQSMPELQADAITGKPHYGELFTRFLDLYGSRFNVATTGIDMAGARYFNKADRGIDKPDRLTLMDPNKIEHDVTGGSFNVLEIFRSFRNIHGVLSHRLQQMHDGRDMNDSILGSILAGEYDIFQQTRQALQASLDAHGGKPARLLPLPALSAKHDLVSTKIPRKPKKYREPPRA